MSSSSVQGCSTSTTADTTAPIHTKNWDAMEKIVARLKMKNKVINSHIPQWVRHMRQEWTFKNDQNYTTQLPRTSHIHMTSEANQTVSFAGWKTDVDEDDRPIESGPDDSHNTMKIFDSGFKCFQLVGARNGWNFYLLTFNFEWWRVRLSATDLDLTLSQITRECREPSQPASPAGNTIVI